MRDAVLKNPLSLRSQLSGAALKTHCHCETSVATLVVAIPWIFMESPAKLMGIPTSAFGLALVAALRFLRHPAQKTRRFLESASLHPPLAALRRFPRNDRAFLSASDIAALHLWLPLRGAVREAD